MANYWTEDRGKTLTLDEQVTIALHIIFIETNATVSIISGKLSDGLYLDGIQLKGTPAGSSKRNKF